MLLGLVKDLDLFPKASYRKLPNIWLIIHMYMLKSVSEAADGKILCLRSSSMKTFTFLVKIRHYLHLFIFVNIPYPMLCILRML